MRKHGIIRTNSNLNPGIRNNKEKDLGI